MENLLNTVKLLLVAVKHQEITVFPANDNTADYIQMLENAVKREESGSIDIRMVQAGCYLSDGELSTAEMVKAIENHEDQDDLIDNVEGVVVWHKIEGSVTCEDFLGMIGD